MPIEVEPVRSEADYIAYARESEDLFRRDPEPGSPELERAEALVTALMAWDEVHNPIDWPHDPIDTLTELMLNRRLTVDDLGKLLGSRARAEAILAREEPLTAATIEVLAAEWKIPAEALVRHEENRSAAAE